MNRRQDVLFHSFPAVERVRRDTRTPLTTRELAQAETIYRRAWGARCQHDEPCSTWRTCISKIAWHRRDVDGVAR